MFNKLTRTETIQGSLIFIKGDDVIMIVDTFDPESFGETTIVIGDDCETTLNSWGIDVEEIKNDCERIENIKSFDALEVYFIQA